MDSFRLQNGITTDARLAVVARRTGLTRAEILALWIALYDHASRNRPRGTLDGSDAEELATLLELDADKCAAALDALYDKGLITTDNKLSEWLRVQYTSTERVRAHRDRRRHPTDTRTPDTHKEKSAHDRER